MPLLTVFVATVLAGQASPAPSPAHGTIAVAPSAPTGQEPSAVFTDAIEGALIDAGFILIPGVSHARYVATLKVVRTARGAVRTKDPRPRTTGAGGVLVNSGVGLGVVVPLKSKAVVGQLVATELTLRIARRGAAGPAWEGRAVTYQVDGARGDDQAALAQKLSTAILRNLDGPSGVLVSVP